jgi:tetratricopeptide (TPR) repeat protein
MDEIVSVTSRSVDRALEEGLFHLDEGRYEDALAVFEKALRRLGPQMDLYHWKGIALRHLGRLGEAIRALELSAQAESPEGSVYELAVLLLDENLDPERGTRLLTELSDGGDLPAREYLAHRAYEEGRFADVIALARAPREAEAESQWPDSAEGLETLEGIALTEMGHLDEARFQLKRAARKSPGCASHITNLGRVFQLEQRYARALKYYMQAIELDPDDAIPRINLAHLYEEMGQTERAHTMFRSLYEGFGDDTAVLEDYARFLARHDQLEDAVRLVEQALNDQPEDETDDDLAAFLGWLAMDAGDKPKAREIWEAQVAERPDAFAARHYLAGMLAETGETARALDLLEDAGRIDAAATRHWCVRPDGEVEPCFAAIASHPRFRRVAGLADESAH